MNDPYAYGNLIGVVKDGESNIKTDVMALDRNLTNSIGQSTSSIMANTGAGFSSLNMVEDARFKDTKDNINRNSDFLLNDSRRSQDANILNQNRNGDLGLNNVNRNSDFLLNDSRRSQDASILNQNRNGDFGLTNVNRNSDVLGNLVNRNTDVTQGLIKTQADYGVMNVNRNSDIGLSEARRNAEFAISNTDRNSDVLGTSINRNTDTLSHQINYRGDIGLTNANRNSDFILSDSRRASDMMSNLVSLNGAAAVNATKDIGLANLTAIERNGAAAVLASDRNGLAAQLATERNGAANLSETIRNAGQIRDLVYTTGLDQKNSAAQISLEQARHARESGFLIKDNDLKTVDAGYKGQLQTAHLAQDVLKMKSELEKQAADNSALAARDVAMISREILHSKGEMMAHISAQHTTLLLEGAKNTAAIQLDAAKNVTLQQIDSAKNKDLLANQLNGITDKLANMDVTRVRDKKDDFRGEYLGLKYEGHGHHDHGYHHRHHGYHYGHHDHHDHHRGPEFHNNLYSNIDDRDRGRSRSRSRSRERRRSGPFFGPNQGQNISN